jgi:hypothetical protein
MKIYIMSLREVCGGVTARGAYVDESNATPSPCNCEFDVTPCKDCKDWTVA